MQLSYSPEYRAFQEEVRQFLAQNWDKEQARAPGAGKEYVTAFRKKATELGYLNRNIPRSYGGSEQPPDVIKAQIIREEFGRARAPTEVAGIGMMMLVPTLLEWGEDWQKEMFIAKTVSGEYRWAQGYSEPGSGSDLASLRTRAELVGDEWIINGHKIWTTNAQEATHMFCLCRTEPQESKHAGISYILLDFKQPGVTIRPIKQISGAQEFCETFLDNARTPASWIVGKRGQGWAVSKSNLKHERNSVGSAAGTRELFDKLLRLAKETTLDGRPAIEHPNIRHRLAALEGKVQAHLYSGYYQLTRDSQGKPVGVLGLMNKLNATTIGQEIATIVTDIIGDRAMLMPSWDGKRRGNEQWVNQILGSIAMLIAGGTSNIQRNIIAERGLGLPRDVADA